jgi:hypothetical protein
MAGAVAMEERVLAALGMTTLVVSIGEFIISSREAAAATRAKRRTRNKNGNDG